MKKVIALLSSTFLLYSCAPQNVKCVIYNRSSNPLTLYMWHCKPRYPALITVFLKLDKRNTYSNDFTGLMPGDTLSIDKNYNDRHGKILKLSIFRQGGADTLASVQKPTLGLKIVDVTDSKVSTAHRFKKKLAQQALPVSQHVLSIQS